MDVSTESLQQMCGLLVGITVIPLWRASRGNCLMFIFQSNAVLFIRECLLCTKDQHHNKCVLKNLWKDVALTHETQHQHFHVVPTCDLFASAGQRLVTTSATMHKSTNLRPYLLGQEVADQNSDATGSMCEALPAEPESQDIYGFWEACLSLHQHPRQTLQQVMRTAIVEPSEHWKHETNLIFSVNTDKSVLEPIHIGALEGLAWLIALSF
eukprot:514702-Amphidinium_carterae.1